LAVGKVQGSGGRKSHSGVQGQSPGEKHDINFALRITLVHAYSIATFIRHKPIVTFVTGFSIASKVTFYLYPNRLPSPLCVYTSHRICANLRIESREGWGGAAASLCPLPWRH